MKNWKHLSVFIAVTILFGLSSRETGESRFEISPHASSPRPTKRALASIAARPTVTSSVGTQAAVQHLQVDSVKSWRVQTHLGTETVRTLSGGRVRLPGQSLSQRSRSFLERYSRGLFGVASAELELASPDSEGTGRTTFVQRHNGVLVYGSQVTLVFSEGELTRVQSDLSPWSAGMGGFPNEPEDRVKNDGQLLGSAIFRTRLGSEPGQLVASAPLKYFYPDQGALIPAYELELHRAEAGSPTALVLLLDARNRNPVLWRKGTIDQ